MAIMPGRVGGKYFWPVHVMGKTVVFIILILSYVVYSMAVYFSGTQGPLIQYSITAQQQVNKGKTLFQENNCIACHQLYGLGGLIGPELTTAWSDKHRGEQYIRAMLSSGSGRMPDFKFTPEEVQSILSFLHYVDSSATTYKSKTE